MFSSGELGAIPARLSSVSTIGALPRTQSLPAQLDVNHKHTVDGLDITDKLNRI